MAEGVSSDYFRGNPTVKNNNDMNESEVARVILPGQTERKIKVDVDVAYESGLCKSCKPTRDPRWESGALLWIQIGFALLVALIVILMIVAIVLSQKYLHNQRNPHSSSSSFS